MTHEVTGLRPGQPGVMLFGSSDIAWGSVPLPFDLGPLGMPGCRLYASGDHMISMPTSGGTARLTYTIPAAASLDGLQCFNQYFSIDPGINPFGVTASNAGVGTCRWP